MVFNRTQSPYHNPTKNETFGQEQQNDSIIESTYDTSSATTSSVYRLTVRVKRRLSFYVLKIIVPCVVFYFVALFTYTIPVEAGEKKSYSTSILLSIIMYLKDISDFIPKTSSLPLLTIYFNLNLILTFVCLVASTLIYSFYYIYVTKRSVSPWLSNKIAGDGSDAVRRRSRSRSRSASTTAKLQRQPARRIRRLSSHRISSRERHRHSVDATTTDDDARPLTDERRANDEARGKQVFDVMRTLKFFLLESEKSREEVGIKLNEHDQASMNQLEACKTRLLLSNPNNK